MMATPMSAAHLEIPTQPAGPVLELHGQRKVFTIPFGLKSLLEEMTTESLRHNPVNIYEFLANLLEDKLKAKEADDQLHGTGRHSWQWRRWSWDGSSLLSNEELVEFLSKYNIKIEEAQHLATIIQSAYRSFLARKEYHEKKEKHDQHKEELWDEWRHEGNFFVSGKDVQDILSFYGITLFEANAFATKIQKVVRGHLQREHLASLDPELADHLKCLGITRKQANEHATRIQKTFRGYAARKGLRTKKDQDDSSEEEWEEEYEGEDAGRQVYQKTKWADEDEEDELNEEQYEEATQAAIKIQSGFRGMKARKMVKKMKAEMSSSEEEESEMEGEGAEVAYPTQAKLQPSKPGDPATTNPKYDAYFPVGYEESDRIVGPDGVEIPPKFTHQHFGDIDPFEVKNKFSQPQFRDKMSLAFKDLNEAKNKRLEEVMAPKPSAPQKQPSPQQPQTGPGTKPQAPVQAASKGEAPVQSDARELELPLPRPSVILQQSSEPDPPPPPSEEPPHESIQAIMSELPPGEARKSSKPNEVTEGERRASANSRSGSLPKNPSQEEEKKV